MIVNAAVTPEFMNCPQNISIDLFDGESAPVRWEPPTFESACYAGEITSTHSPGDVFGIGSTKVTYTATTSAGIRTCAFDVTLNSKGIMIHEVVTPNGDGENDVWVIKNIEHFADNNVVVFDRWGAPVYRASAYNGDTVGWTGENLPGGTYYFSLIVHKNGSEQVYKGFIELVK